MMRLDDDWEWHDHDDRSGQDQYARGSQEGWPHRSRGGGYPVARGRKGWFDEGWRGGRGDPYADSRRVMRERGADRAYRDRDYRDRDYRDRDDRAAGQEPFSHRPFGHAPFSHSAFGESDPPRYFGTGSHGHGGGPSFTGGTYGTADERSDAPYFEEVGFNRGYYEDPFAGDPRGAQGYPYPRAFGSPRPQTQRRYPLGPKGYQRTDERLREDISERLMHAYDIDSSDVTVDVSGGKVVLEGTVPDRRMKHAIEDLADGAAGVQDVDNRIRVVNRTHGTAGSGAGAGGLTPSKQQR